MEFNPQAHIEKMKPSVDKLLTSFQKKSITFSPSDGEFNNVVFSYSGKERKMSHHSFYRFSGICCVIREKTKESVETIEVTDDIYLQSYIRPIIETFFDIK